MAEAGGRVFWPWPLSAEKGNQGREKVVLELPSDSSLCIECRVSLPGVMSLGVKLRP